MQYHGKNTIHMCLVRQNNPISLISICVLYRRDPIPDSIPDSYFYSRFPRKFKAPAFDLASKKTRQASAQIGDKPPGPIQ